MASSPDFDLAVARRHFVAECLISRRLKESEREGRADFAVSAAG